MARVDADVIAARARVRNLEREVTLAKAANAKGGIGKGDNAVKAAEDRLDSAVKDLNKRLETRDLYGRQKYGDHQKLGSVRTIAVNLSERATYIPGTDRVRDGLVSRMAQFLVPTTSSFERAQAARLGRDAVADLAARAVMRQKLVFNRNGLGKLIPRRARSLEDLSPKQRQYMQWEDDLLRSKYGLQFKDDAAESAKHYADGGIPVERSSNNYVFDTDGNVMVKVPLSRGYASQGLSDNVLDEHAARAMAARLRFMSDKYGLNQAAMHQVPDYWKAVTANDVQKVDAVVDNVLAWARSSSDWPYLAERFRLSDNLGAREHVRRMLDDMADAFTTRRGNWNQDLWRAMRHTDEKGKVYFTTEGVNGAESLVDEMAFMQGKFETPMSVLVHEGDDHFLMPLKNGVSAAMWNSMGRSLARMTRNPIWYGNYVTARGQMSAMEKHYASVFGETYARQLFTEAAAERAYHLTMSWVDNPAIRTNLSWQVRNIARYYRAQEDFARRLIRMGKYDPVSIQKANLAWQAQQDFGFTYQDQYGDDYFMYPGSAAVMGVVQNVFGGLGLGGMKYGAAPMAFGGKVTWLSPSLDPQSWLPTVSSPWMALTLQPLLRTMPGVNSLFHDIERIAFGETASNMDYADMGMGDSILGDLAGGFYQTLPPVMKRLFAANPIVNANDRPGSYGYKMTAKTLMAMASAGRIPEGEEWLDPNKRRKFLEEMEQRTFEVAGLSAIFGLFAPASPQYQEDNVSLAAREAGYQALNPAFREMVQASLDNGKDYMEATVSWMQHNPNDNIFFVGLTETIGGPAVAATEKNVEFLASHEELFRKNDTAAAFFTPEGQEAGSDEAALRSLKYFDLRRYRELSDVLMDLGSAEGRMEAMVVAQGLKEARRNTPQFDAEGNKTPEWEMLEKTESQANIILDTMYPTRDAGLGEWMEKDEAEFAVEAQKVVDAARELAAEGNTYGMYVLPLADLYVQFKREFDDFQNSPHGDNYAEEKATMGDIWAESVNAWWSIYGPKGYPRDRAEKLESLFTNSINKGWAQKVAIPADEEQ
jgi:hypothetical protein